MSTAPQLRPYQVNQIAAVQRELQTVRSTLIVAPTGSGKTVSMAELSRLTVTGGLVAGPGKVLILVGRDELVRQTVAKLEAVGLSPDVEKASQRASTLAKVVVASVQSLRAARLKRWAPSHFALVIVDECHHAVATGYRAIIDHFDGAKIVGYTATPDRADGKALGEVFASVAHEYGIRAAIDAGFLVSIVARRVVVDSVDLSAVKQRAGDFAQDQLSKVMNEASAIRGQVVPLLELARERLTVAYGVDVAHAEALAAALNSLRSGSARAVSGQTDDSERAALLAAFGRGEFQFLCNCDLLVEGWDCPEVACVAVVRPTRSRARFVQMAGRGLRPAPWTNKRDCLVLTFTDANTCGLIGPADCLAGRGELADDVRDEIDRLIGSAQLEIGPVIEQAIEAVELRRAAMALSAVVNWRTEHIDPFVGATRGAALPPAAAGRAGLKPSAEQLAVIEKLTANSSGRGGIADKLPPQFTRADAYELISRLQNRQRAGLCSYRQAKLLTAAGVIDTTKLSSKRAGELLLMARGPFGIDWARLGKAIASQPETRTPEQCHACSGYKLLPHQIDPQLMGCHECIGEDGLAA